MSVASVPSRNARATSRSSMAPDCRETISHAAVHTAATRGRRMISGPYEGKTLKERISKGPLELDDALDIAAKDAISRRCHRISVSGVTSVATASSARRPRRFAFAGSRRR